MHAENDIPPILRRTFVASIEYLGIQRSATDILSILYLEKHKNQSALSINEIKKKSSLSLSSISVLCSRMEAEGILIRRTDDSGMGRGRRKILYEFAMSMDELLILGMRKYIHEIGRICRDIRLHQKQNVSDDGLYKELLDKLETEICLFFSENSRLANETNPLWLGNKSNDDVDLKEKIVEGAF